MPLLAVLYDELMRQHIADMSGKLGATFRMEKFVNAPDEVVLKRATLLHNKLFAVHRNEAVSLFFITSGACFEYRLGCGQAPSHETGTKRSHVHAPHAESAPPQKAHKGGGKAASKSTWGGKSGKGFDTGMQVCACVLPYMIAVVRSGRQARWKSWDPAQGPDRVLQLWQAGAQT